MSKEIMDENHLPDWVIERIIARRGRQHAFTTIEPAKSALIVIDLQNSFLLPGQPAEVPTARAILPNVNRLAAAMRQAGGRVVWIKQVQDAETALSRSVWLNNFADPTWATRMEQSLTPGNVGHELHADLKVEKADIVLPKRRFSAFIQGSSSLDQVLRSAGIDTVIVVGTVTNVCCEATARDAMMLNYKVHVVSDATAARSSGEHTSSLASLAVNFADIRSTDEMIELLASAQA